MRRLLVWVAMAGALLGSMRAGVASPSISVVPESPRVGEVMFLEMRPEKELLRAACTWGRASYRLLAHGDAYEVVLPVSLRTKAGGSHLMVYWRYADGEMGRERVSVEVLRREFGVQHLKLSESQESKYSAAETERERELIGEALDQVSQERRWDGSFARPAEGRVSTSFGLERHVNGKFSYRHRGIDIAAPEGAEVRAAADGVVSLADGSFLLHGQTLIVDHGQGVSTLYLHMSRLEVCAGQEVSRGQVIGRVGSTGVATGPHLHFAVYAHHEAVDPLFWMDLPAM